MIALIAARSKNNVIGKNGRIPWKIHGEQDLFRNLTIGNAVIMGRASYEEIGHPLKNRTVIVVSNSLRYHEDGLLTAGSLSEALTLVQGRDVYISGGYELFKEAIPIVDRMYITEIDLVVEDGDTFFPTFDVNDFNITVGETFYGNLRYTRMIYTRKSYRE